MKKIKMGLIFFIMILDLLLLIRVTYFRFYEVSRPIDIKSYIKDDKIHITFYTNEYQLNNKAYCIIKKDNEVPSINDKIGSYLIIVVVYIKLKKELIKHM